MKSIMLLKPLHLLILLVLLAATPILAWANSALFRQPEVRLAQAGAISKSEAAELARARYGGRVLKVDEVSNGGRVVYRVRLLLDGGRIKTVNIDGNSGNIV